MKVNSKPSRTAKWTGLILGAVLIVMVIVLATRGRAPARIERTPASQETIGPSAPPAIGLPAQPTPIEVASAPSPAPPPSPAPAAAPPPAGPTPEPTMDPELQPRQLHVLDFRGIASVPEGYKVEGLRLTDKGFQLEPAKPGEENQPRFGTIESPPFELEFPSNAVSPLWLEETPEGTANFVEVAVSPDGQGWGIWHPVEVDDDSVGQISPTLQDGRPNPNAGHTPGGVLFWGMREWKYYRFRITLSSEVKDSPTLSTFHLYYQDSTLGQGHIAQENEIDKSP